MDDEFIHVDENDKVIGYASKEEIREKNLIYRVSVLWVTNSKGEILLAKRALSKKNDPGKWGPAVAGTVEKGETYYSNIIKEAKEEIGLTEIYPVKEDKRRVKGKHNYFSQWHHVSVNKKINEFRIDKTEVSEIRWFSRDELSKMVKKSPSLFLDSIKNLVKE